MHLPDVDTCLTFIANVPCQTSNAFAIPFKTGLQAALSRITFASARLSCFYLKYIVLKLLISNHILYNNLIL